MGVPLIFPPDPPIAPRPIARHSGANCPTDCPLCQRRLSNQASTSTGSPPLVPFSLAESSLLAGLARPSSVEPTIDLASTRPNAVRGERIPQLETDEPVRVEYSILPTSDPGLIGEGGFDPAAAVTFTRTEYQSVRRAFPSSPPSTRTSDPVQQSSRSPVPVQDDTIAPPPSGSNLASPPTTHPAIQPTLLPNPRTISDPIEAIVRPPVADPPSFSDSSQDRSIFVSPELSLPTGPSTRQLTATPAVGAGPSPSSATPTPVSVPAPAAGRDDAYPLADVPHLPNGPRRTRFESLEAGTLATTRRSAFTPRGPWPLSRPELQASSSSAQAADTSATTASAAATDDPTAPLLSAATRVHAAVEERVRRARSDLDAVRARLSVLDGEHRQLERERRGIGQALEDRAGSRSIWAVPADEDEEAAELARARQRVARRIRADLALNPTDTESSLRNARQALRTAVLYAERLDLVTRTLSSIADLPSTTRTTSVQRAGLGPGSGSPPAERHARVFPPGASASIQRSLAQLRAAQARIEQALEEQAAERQLERLEQIEQRGVRSPSPTASEATARGPDGGWTAVPLDQPETFGLDRLSRVLFPRPESTSLQSVRDLVPFGSRGAGTDTLSPSNPPPGLSSTSLRVGGAGSNSIPFASSMSSSLYHPFLDGWATNLPGEGPLLAPEDRLGPPGSGGGDGDEGGSDGRGSPGGARRGRKYTLAVKLDANGDAVEEETAEEKAARRNERRKLVGR